MREDVCRRGCQHRCYILLHRCNASAMFGVQPTQALEIWYTATDFVGVALEVQNTHGLGIYAVQGCTGMSSMPPTASAIRTVGSSKCLPCTSESATTLILP